MASKLMPFSGAGFLPWHQNWCHFDYLLTYSQWAKPFIKVFLKKPSKILLLRGNPVIAPSVTPCLKAILWTPSLIPSGKGIFLSSFQKNSAHLTHIWKPFCQPIRRGFLLQFLTATFATEKRHDFWKNFPSTLYRNFRSRKTTYFPKLFQKMFSPLYRTFSSKKRKLFFKKVSLFLYRKFFRTNLNPFFGIVALLLIPGHLRAKIEHQSWKNIKNSACLVFRSRRYIFSGIQL